MAHQFLPLFCKQNGKMNFLQLPNKWVQYLLQKPENGMGYQLVKIVLRNGEIIRKLRVLNGSKLLLPADKNISNEEIVQLETEESK